MFDPSGLVQVDPDADESALLLRIAQLEQVKSAAAAGQARAAARLDATRRAREAAAGVPAAKRGRGLAGEVALARQDSPNRGGQHLGLAKALILEMPHTLAALEAGVLSEWRATLLVRESACLDVEDRRTLDAEMCAELTALAGMGDQRLVARAKTIAYRLDPHAVVARAANAVQDSRVTIRPVPDCMARVTVLLPMAQGVAVYAAAHQEANRCGDGRSRGQVMTDTIFERVTGRPAPVPVPVAVNLVISDQTLLGGDDSPAVVDGYGPVPAQVARELVSDAVTDARSRATLRRLYRHPGSGALVAMQSRARRFPTALAMFIRLRDQTCRTPYCDAPIRHTDHARPAARGGATSALNGLGLCAQCNYTKEAPGWRVHTFDDNGTHTALFVTPTGVVYRSTAPPPPGTVDMYHSQTELRLATEFALPHAA
ncbi:HNH endonuclease [Mycobacterium sp. 21AC1]|uniref:HNH endonuclease n=1 Tax=[Mycobacterium] appelbergii TaxID=2939269 RepID=UPI002938DC3E|nr:HNH endonuclease [Mycobacterium sp. 21AC1]MDV3128077.1 HNH endonuclease [Mycobacterium sp. 21AC1]